MKRSSSDSSPDDNRNKSKKIKIQEEDSVSTNQNYLQLVLTRIVELQQEIDEEDDVFDENGNLDESETDYDIMKKVLSKVFDDLPGLPPEPIKAFNDSPQKSSPINIETVKDKNMELYGFKACRKLAVDFVEDATELRPFKTPIDEIQGYNFGHVELEERKKILKSFDLYLATKERDYAARLMAE